MKNILSALAAMLVIFAMGIFKEQLNGDRSFYELTLEQGGEYTYTLDVSKMGTIKYFVQPNSTILYLRCNVPKEVNALRCEITGVENVASQNGKKGQWKPITKDDLLKKHKKWNDIPLNLEYLIPRADIYRYDVGWSKIVFVNGNSPYAVLNVKIINSKYSSSQ